jgi:serine/threonine protein kinase
VHIRQLTDEFNVLDIHNECETLSITNNYQHILHCYGVYTENSKIFVVTEPIYLKLETFLSDTTGVLLTTEERIQLALELAQCIQYLHREKVFFSCIHPKSIMITADQHIKLNVVGEKDDFLYISPERLLRRRDITPFYDNIYAFGLVLYRLFHTDANDIELFRSGKWLLPLVENIDTIDVSKTYYIDYVYRNHSSMKFQMPKMNPTVNETIKELIRACCSVDVQQRPDINVIITILNIEKVCHPPHPNAESCRKPCQIEY